MDQVKFKNASENTEYGKCDANPAPKAALPGQRNQALCAVLWWHSFVVLPSTGAISHYSEAAHVLQMLSTGLCLYYCDRQEKDGFIRLDDGHCFNEHVPVF